MHPQFAPVWKRFAAQIIDSVIIFIAAGLILLLSAKYIAAADAGVQSLFLLSVGVLLSAAAALFDSSSWRGTPGKKLLGIKICGLCGGGLNFRRAFARNIVKIFSVWGLLGACLALFTKNKQTAHDLLADTAVFETAADVLNLNITPAARDIKIFIIFLLVIFTMVVAGSYQILKEKYLLARTRSVTAGLLKSLDDMDKQDQRVGRMVTKIIGKKGFWKYDNTQYIISYDSGKSVSVQRQYDFYKGKKHEVYTDDAFFNKAGGVIICRYQKTDDLYKLLQSDVPAPQRVSPFKRGEITREEILSKLPPPPTVDNGADKTEQERLDLARSVTAGLADTLGKYAAKEKMPRYRVDYADVYIGKKEPGWYEDNTSYSISSWLAHDGYAALVTRNYSYNDGKVRRGELDKVIFTGQGGNAPVCKALWDGSSDKLCALLLSNEPLPKRASAPAQAKPAAVVPAKPMTEEEQLDKVLETMTALHKAMDNYIAKNGKVTNPRFGYGETLDALDFKGQDRQSIYIKAGDYRVFAMLSPYFGGYWIHVDGPSDGGVLRWQADGQKQCHLSAQQCQYLSKYGFPAN